MLRFTVFPPTYHDLSNVGGFTPGASPLTSANTKVADSFTQLDAGDAAVDGKASVEAVTKVLIAKNQNLVSGANAQEAKAKLDHLGAEIKKFDKDGDGNFSLDEFNALTQDLVDEGATTTANLSKPETDALHNHITAHDDKTHQTVKQAQQELNGLIKAGKIPGPPLKEDGLEGPKTRAAKAAAEKLKTEQPSGGATSDAGVRRAQYDADTKTLQDANAAWEKAPPGPAKAAAEKKLVALGDAYNKNWPNGAPPLPVLAEVTVKIPPNPAPTNALDTKLKEIEGSKRSLGDKLFEMFMAVMVGGRAPVQDGPGGSASTGQTNRVRRDGMEADQGPLQNTLDQASGADIADFMNRMRASGYKPEQVLNQAQRKQVFEKLPATESDSRIFMAADILRCSTLPGATADSIQLDTKTLNSAVGALTDAELAKLKPGTLKALASGTADPVTLKRLNAALAGAAPTTTTIPLGGPPTTNPVRRDVPPPSSKHEEPDDHAPAHPAEAPRPAKHGKAKQAHKAKKKHHFLKGLKHVGKGLLHAGKSVVKTAVKNSQPTSVPV
ncbi:MAG: hypothetical protein JWM80_5810 [Cyanobacteria bacterium RYN_339]|nr:hypothetical protein [Cyanobacteria bacterium RYN_339]